MNGVRCAASRGLRLLRRVFGLAPGPRHSHQRRSFGIRQLLLRGGQGRPPTSYLFISSLVFHCSAIGLTPQFPAVHVLLLLLPSGILLLRTSSKTLRQSAAAPQSRNVQFLPQLEKIGWSPVSGEMALIPQEVASGQDITQKYTSVTLGSENWSGRGRIHSHLLLTTSVIHPVMQCPDW